MVAVFLAGTPAALLAGEAQGVAELRQENAKLRQRLDRMESQMQQLMDTVRALKASAGGAAQAEAQFQPLTAAEVANLRHILDRTSSAKLSPVLTGLDARLYGYIKLDAAYDTQRTDVGAFARWVESEEFRSSDEQFNMTARQTRLGLAFSGGEDTAPITSGKVEVDFFGAASQENKPAILVRHAFLNLDWPDSGWSVLAGQTSDVISPLYPTTLNYTVAWWVGNIGYRHPQIRVTKETPIGESTDLTIQAAISRTVGTRTLMMFDPGDTGEDSGHPTAQGRIALATPILSERPTTIGLSGHYGDEEYDLDRRDNSRDYHSWSLNLDAQQPLAETLTLKGEAFVGENLDDYFGGIGQGVDVALGREIASRGGWVALAMGPYGSWSFNVGGSAEDLTEGDVEAPAARTFNSSIFGNALYAVNDHTQVGFELSHWRTDYKSLSDGNSVRGQLSFIYKF
jgi:hypothetical protein